MAGGTTLSRSFSLAAWLMQPETIWWPFAAIFLSTLWLWSVFYAKTEACEDAVQRLSMQKIGDDYGVTHVGLHGTGTTARQIVLFTKKEWKAFVRGRPSVERTSKILYCELRRDYPLTLTARLRAAFSRRMKRDIHDCTTLAQ